MIKTHLITQYFVLLLINFISEKSLLSLIRHLLLNKIVPIIPASVFSSITMYTTDPADVMFRWARIRQAFVPFILPACWCAGNQYSNEQNGAQQHLHSAEFLFTYPWCEVAESLRHYIYPSLYTHTQMVSVLLVWYGISIF